MDSASSTVSSDTRWRKRESNLIRFSDRSSFFWLCIAGAIALAVGLFWSSLFIGFLLDDFFHLNYLIRAFGGEPNALLKLLWSNWSPDTTLTSYRPLVSFSLAADYALWNINAIGYHITNLLLFSGCIVFVALIALELSAIFAVANARWVAIASAFLFASYPLHPEAVAWIIGRVDLLCGFLTFASMWFYLVHRRTSRLVFLVSAIAAFLFAMMSKEMAVTLPLVLTLLEWLSPTAPRTSYLRFKLTRALLCMWAALAGFAIWRTVLLGTVVGGYGGSGWKTIKQGLKNFADNATLAKLVFGASEEFPTPPALRSATQLAFLVIDVCALIFLKIKTNIWRVYLFLFLWTFISVLPTFQIWHIWPNLVGSRLFFLGSAPLCIFFALAAVGAVENSKWSQRKVVAGGIAIGVLTICWSMVLSTNLQSWNVAGKEAASVRSTLASYFPKLNPQYRLLIPALPQDYKGAPILGRPEYLATLCKPPFADSDYTPFVLTLEPMIAGGNECIGPLAFELAKLQSQEVLNLVPETDPVFARINEYSVEKEPLIQVSPLPPLSLADRHAWLRGASRARPIVTYDCTKIPGATTVRMYISKAWHPFSNAPRPAPPDPLSVEKEIGPLPLKSESFMPISTPGVHDVAVLAFDKNDKPVGNLSEVIPVIWRSE